VHLSFAKLGDPAIERPAALKKWENSRAGEARKGTVGDNKFELGEGALQTDSLDIEDCGVCPSAVEAEDCGFGGWGCHES